MFSRFFIILLSLITCFHSFSQIAMGQWREHLPYNKVIGLAYDGTDRIYCATPYSLFYYSKAEQSIQKLNSINKLSDIGVSKIAFDNETKTLVIAYENGNIDLMNDDIVFNMADIKNKPMIGSKQINHIFFNHKIAYLSTNFGIVALDLIKKEIKDTYFIGPNGQSMRVNQLTVLDSFIYAVSEFGIYKALISNQNLANYQSWSVENNIPNSTSEFNHITIYKNQLITSKKGSNYGTDTLFVKDSTHWNYLLLNEHGPFTALKGNGDSLFICSEYGFTIYKNNLTNSFIAFDYNQPSMGPIYPRPNDILVDNENIVWIADELNALVQNPFEWYYKFIIPSGPFSKNSWSLSIEGGNLWMVSGGYQTNASNSYLKQGIYRFFNNNWTSLHSENTTFLDTIDDVVSVAINPSNPEEVYIGTWGQGLLKIIGNQLAGSYNQLNSSLQSASNRPGFIGISGLTYDLEGNLWVANTASPNGLSRLTPDGKWKSFNLSPYVSEDLTGQIVVDDLSQKWIVLQRGKGILVYNDNNTPDIITDDRKTLLTGASGSGGLPNSNVFSIAKDLDGEIWVGTSEGVAVFYAPELIFSGNEFDAQQIYFEQEGISQYLLESEEVSAIAIDGANRKWLGTRNAGVFLMSSDGTKQIHHFNKDNSPILSNNIMNIAIDQKSGEVFFATDRGLISYRSDATQGAETQLNVTIFPNPVRPDFQGQITVNGLVYNASVKFTDIAGNLIFETTAKGGTAVWNGKTLLGERASTGIYLVFSTNEDGSETMVSKILFVN